MFTRRRFIQSTGALGLLAGLRSVTPAYAWQDAAASALNATPRGSNNINLRVYRKIVEVGGRPGEAITVNGTVPAPLLRMREGEEVTIRVDNDLDVDTSIHWHGILLPYRMDGVPGVSFPGIRAGETFTYRYRLQQSGTYWYHSHKALQEQAGHYGPMIIDPIEPDPFTYDREYVVMFSDWTFDDPEDILSNLKKQNDYYNFQRRTVFGSFFGDVAEYGLMPTLQDRLQWAQMRMEPSDILDVTDYGYTYLINGLPAQANWTALFRPGERVRLRFINGSTMTYFNVRIPGLPMTIVAADGQNVQPVETDEFQIAVAETYDAIVEPKEDRAYTLMAESMDRSGYVRGTLAPRRGMSAPVPELRPRPLRSMVDMGMPMHQMEGMAGMNMSARGAGGGAMPGMDHGGMEGMNHSHMPGMEMKPGSMKGHGSMPGIEKDTGSMSGHGGMAGMGADAMSGHGDMSGMQKAPSAKSAKEEMGMMRSMIEKAGPIVARHGPDEHGPGNTNIATVQRNRLGEPGTGLEEVNHRVLVYNDLRALKPYPDQREPGREIVLHLTGNMRQYMWSFNGKEYSAVDGPIQFYYGERLRLTMVNDTMMEHPIHLHGMWMNLVNGADLYKPRKHTISVRPASRTSLDITAHAPGNWAFHCHLLYHMEMGMFRVVNVSSRAVGDYG
jgi:CopA family copper-resistance protein